MIHIDHPLALLLLFALLVAGLFVYPFLKADRFRITPAKAVATAIALAIAFYNGSLALILVFLWPLSFIWFPEYWGGYTGFFRGHYIDEKSPPILMSLMGWFFLLVFPCLLYWIMNR